MALSEVSIVNLALTLLGQDRVISTSDDVEAARVMRSLWDGTRDSVMAGHPWKFAIKRVELPALAAAPAFGWSREFALPEECLRLVQVGDDWTFYETDTATFALEGGSVLTDEAAPLRVRYVQRITNTGLWPLLPCRPGACAAYKPRWPSSAPARPRPTACTSAQHHNAPGRLTVRHRPASRPTAALLLLLLAATLSGCAAHSLPPPRTAPPPPPAALMTEQPLIDWRDYSARARNWLRTASELVMQSQPR